MFLLYSTGLSVLPLAGSGREYFWLTGNEKKKTFEIIKRSIKGEKEKSISSEGIGGEITELFVS